ncbi:MAG: sugar transferase [Chitinophagaceae bacterium]
MELESLNQNQSASKTYKHFTICSDLKNNKKSEGQREFFYVGKNDEKIDFLIKSFDCGYAAETVEKAKSILGRISEKNSLPDIIIFDAAMGELSLKELHRYITTDSNYAAVPFVLDASGTSPNELNLFKSFRFLDEIVFIEKMIPGSETLRSKIYFLKKFKARSQSILPGKSLYKQMTAIDSRFLLKRIFDIVVSSAAILLLSPVYLLIALIIKLESRGPVLYVSQRAGRGYRVFEFYKFRTMEMGADEKINQLSHLNHYNAHDDSESVFFKVINDTRITRIGAFLRNSSLDELPQFINVLLGEMSLVGNRPLPLYEAVKLTTNEWAERFMAPAGITGLWQIKKRGREEMSMEERIKLDISYTQKYNFMYDLWIMVNTPAALIQKSNT